MNFGLMILYLILGFVLTAILGLAFKWWDRKLTALIQWRVGPPWFQPLADICKLLGKETIVPERAQRTVFLLAPLVGLAGVTLAATILWVVNIQPEASFVGDIIVVIYLLTLPTLAIIIGGSASANPYGSVGASREMKLLLSYELPLLLALVTTIIKAGNTFSLGAIYQYQSTQGPLLYSLSGVIAFVVAILCVQAKLGLVPFDIAEAETEIIAGPFTEYSGPPLAVIKLMQAMMLVTVPMLVILVFWGGFHLRGLGVLWSILKLVVLVVIATLIRNTNPRLRIDQAVKFFWFFATPLALIAVILATYGL